jgi:hypothetical protein
MTSLPNVITPNGVGVAVGISEDKKSVLVFHGWNDVPEELKKDRVKSTSISFWYPMEEVKETK